eukprot:1211101-Karenia_brevis.AAC.1
MRWSYCLSAPSSSLQYAQRPLRRWMTASLTSRGISLRALGRTSASNARAASAPVDCPRYLSSLA